MSTFLSIARSLALMTTAIVGPSCSQNHNDGQSSLPNAAFVQGGDAVVAIADGSQVQVYECHGVTEAPVEGVSARQFVAREGTHCKLVADGTKTQLFATMIKPVRQYFDYVLAQCRKVAGRDPQIFAAIAEYVRDEVAPNADKYRVIEDGKEVLAFDVTHLVFPEAGGHATTFRLTYAATATHKQAVTSSRGPGEEPTTEIVADDSTDASGESIVENVDRLLELTVTISEQFIEKLQVMLPHLDSPAMQDTVFAGLGVDDQGAYRDGESEKWDIKVFSAGVEFIADLKRHAPSAQ